MQASVHVHHKIATWLSESSSERMENNIFIDYIIKKLSFVMYDLLFSSICSLMYLEQYTRWQTFSCRGTPLHCLTTDLLSVLETRVSQGLFSIITTMTMHRGAKIIYY